MGPWARAAAGGVGGWVVGGGGAAARARARAHGPKLGRKAPKGSGPALGPPVAMYFHKKGIGIG